MELTLKGDYYEWYCEWCDSRNQTLIYRVADEVFTCCACKRKTAWATEDASTCGTYLQAA